MNKNVFFVSVIRTMNREATSTYIMTSSLLQGIKQNGCNLVFFAICEHEDEMEEVKDYFSGVADSVIPLPSRIKPNIGTLGLLIHILAHTVSIGFYRKNIKKVYSSFCSVKPDLIISHSPSFESICYSRAMLDLVGNVPYFQYWSDPLALSGVCPENLGIKRKPYKWAENRALYYGDRIIYGTKTLMQFQKVLFPKIADKMYYIDIPYVEGAKIENRSAIPKSLIYAGNYYSNIRNLHPLVRAVSEMPECSLDVYGNGDCPDPHINNICFHSRLSPKELELLEERYECIVCVMNHSSIQIPGKIFYDIVKPIRILVIADGPYSRQITDYLASYNRFVFCENNVEDIKRAIRCSQDFRFNLEEMKNRYSNIRITQFLINGGISDA